MAFDDEHDGVDDADEPEGFEPPLPPDDRLWRHPSEMGAAGAGTRIEIVTRRSPARLALASVTGILVGAIATVAALMAMGAFESPDPTTVRERILADSGRDLRTSDLTVARDVMPAVTRVESWGPTGRTLATGVIIRDDGYVLTTDAAVDGAEGITVTLDDGSVHPAVMAGRDRRADVAVLKIDAAGLPTAAIPDGRTDQMLAFGDPVILVDAALETTPAPIVNRGYVASVSRWVGSDRGVSMYGMVQVDTEQRRGAHSAGGLLLDTSGAVVGMVTARGLGDTDESGFDSDAQPSSRFATPFDHARRVFDDVTENGRFTYPALGITGESLSDEEASRLGVAEGTGLRIDNAEEGSAARRAGLRDGDVILELDRDPIGSLNDLLTALRRHRPGDVVFISYLRNGENEITAAFLTEDLALP